MSPSASWTRIILFTRIDTNYSVLIKMDDFQIELAILIRENLCHSGELVFA